MDYSVIQNPMTPPSITNTEVANRQSICQAGLTLIELLLAIIIGSIVLAGAYASYDVMARQYDKLNTYMEIQERGLSAIRFLNRDLRMAGYKALDDSLNAFWGKIDDPINIDDSDGGCCDSVSVVYDVDATTRHRTTYYAVERANPTRTALYMDIENWDGSIWNMETEDALVVDYIEDFQVTLSDEDSLDVPRLADINLVLRSKTALLSEVGYTTAAYETGNSALDLSDHFYRQSFATTVNLRNLRK